MLTPILFALVLDCGTSVAQTKAVEDGGAWAHARAREISAKGIPMQSAALRDGIIVVPADDLNAPFRKPVDLEGRSLTFTRTGATGFRATAGALTYEEGQGARLPLDLENGVELYAAYDLPFEFPLLDRPVRRVYVSELNAIFADEPPAAARMKQYAEHDLAAQTAGVIAPLLTTSGSQLLGGVQVFVQKSDDSVTFTWKSGAADVQATLSRSGDIRFSYKNVTESIAGAAAVITSGREAWRSQRNVLATIPDSANDIQGSGATAIEAMVDIVGATVNRISDMDVVEVTITTRGAIDRTAIPEGQYLIYTVAIGETTPYQYVRLYLEKGSPDRYSVTSWGLHENSPAARISGSTVRLTFLDDYIAGSRPMPVRISAQTSNMQDVTVAANVSFSNAARRFRTDLSSANGAVIDSAPIAETFSAAVLNPARVWEQVKSSYPQLQDGDIDGVAIYQNFFTDLVTYAGAYSTGGNSGASGLSKGDAGWASSPRTPALLHMNAIGYGHNSTLPRASRVLLHELGHRWLLFVSIKENGTTSQILNPISAHPAQYVDTRAPFRVYTDGDHSVMGGAHFKDNGDGTYTTPEYGAYSYSWLDLYLMGLAAPSEVQPWFYLTNSSPTLGDAYNAPNNRTFRGTRKNVNLQQIIDGTGVRKPAYPNTQRLFRMVYVIVSDPANPLSEEDFARVQDYRRTMEADFVTATGGRAAVVSTIEESQPKPRRRAVGR